MLLRICLILAILGGGAVVAVNFVKVKPAIVTVVDKRDEEATAKKEALGKLKKSQDELTATKTSLTTANSSLTNVTKQLATEKGTAQALEARNTELTTKLADAQGQRDKYQAELAKWAQTSIRPEDVAVLQSNLVKATKAVAGVEQEKSLLASALQDATNQLVRLKAPNGDNPIPDLPPGLRGQIVAVDPKYGFVILNMGEDKKLLVNGILLVARDGKLVAKLQIASVDKTQSVANILPAWRRSEVVEGDEVID